MIPLPIILLAVAVSYLLSFLLRHKAEPGKAVSSIYALYHGVGVDLVDRSPPMVHLAPLGSAWKSPMRRRSQIQACSSRKLA